MEATEIYHQNSPITAGHPDFAETARRLGIGTSNPGGFTPNGLEIWGNINIQTTPDAYVICASMRHAPPGMTEEFGDYCVEIIKPWHFFQRIMRALSQHLVLGTCAIGRVIYNEQSYSDLDNSPGLMGMVKRPQYAYQEEYRLIFEPKSERRRRLRPTLKPFLLQVPAVSSLCKRIA